jgi:hypothetical protein
MSSLVVLAALTGLVCAANSLMLVTVNRRLQLHGELLWETQQRGVPADALRAGAVVGPFAVRDTDGAEFGDTGRHAGMLVVFLSPTCGSCRRLRRDLRPVMAGWGGGRQRVVVVVTGPTAEASFARRLAPVARIVVDRAETVRAAFGVRAFPAIFVVDGSGELAWTGLHADAVPGVVEPAR